MDLAVVAGLAALCTYWTWYGSEYDSKERIFFGVVVGHEREYGNFSLDELEAIRGPGGLTIERASASIPKGNVNAAYNERGTFLSLNSFRK